MELPDDCRFETRPPLQFPDAEACPDNCCRVLARFYLSEDETPLCQFRETELEAYRFFWKSSFDGNAVVQIARRDDAVSLLASRSSLSRLRLRVPPTSIALSEADWEKLEGALNASGFWGLDAADEEFGLDGARWLIEGRRGDIYHSVERWSPQGVIRDLGRVFFALAGPPIAEIEPY